MSDGDQTVPAKKAQKVEAAAEVEPAPEIIAYKGTDANMRCRGFQYELGKTYEHKGRVEACSSGFHSCENPMDVWGYYGLGEGNRFFRVRTGGQIARHDSDTKIASAKITFEAEIKLPELVKAAVKWVIDATKGKGDNPSGHYAQIGSSGDSAQIGSSGDYARIGSSGHSAQIGSSGHSARIGSSGDYAQIGSSGHSARIGSSGDSAQIGSSGDSARIGSSGHSARIGSSGHSARIEASGSNACIAIAGLSASAKAGADGAICLAYWDGKRHRFAVGYVGEDGIKADTFYRADNGKLVEA